MTTTDIWLVSWLEIIKGIAFNSFERIDSRRLKYTYEVDEVEWKQLKLDFYRSDLSKAKMVQERLKDLKH